jgi:hypothetical protein
LASAATAASPSRSNNDCSPSSAASASRSMARPRHAFLHRRQRQPGAPLIRCRSACRDRPSQASASARRAAPSMPCPRRAVPLARSRRAAGWWRR